MATTVETHDEKIQWMATWCARQGLALDLQGECGFGRECVGVSSDGVYADYHWHDEEYNRIDPNGDVWTPESAYHKHECVAVLGRGEQAESQLYDWLKWFDENGFVCEKGTQKMDPRLGAIGILLGKHLFVRLVRQTKAEAQS